MTTRFSFSWVTPWPRRAKGPHAHLFADERGPPDGTADAGAARAARKPSAPPRVSTFRLDPASNLNHVAVVALGRENEAGPVITVIHKAINPSGGN
jgi:hypothetical protein